VTLPILLSVPHAGLRIPDELADRCLLTAREIEDDSDEGAAPTYDLADQVAGFVTTDVARAVVDLNRARDDRSPDGVVKTHTIYQVPIWRTPLADDEVERLLDRYHRPYHERLTREAARPGLRVGVDGHTMAAFAPPIAPEPGVERPAICLGDGGGRTLPGPWLAALRDALEHSFERPVAVNQPFRGGYIVRTHCAELPWVQLEMSRAAFLPLADKRDRLLAALRTWCAYLTSA